MKRKTVALYDPYLDVLGGGERHILSILQVLEEAGYQIHIFWDKDLNTEIKNSLHINFKSNITFHPNLFASHTQFSALTNYLELATFDKFFYVTDGSYFFSGAKKNYVFCMVPDKNLYPSTLFNKLKTHNFTFIANSLFTKNWLQKWGTKTEYIYPYIDDKLIHLTEEAFKKEKIILSVGRFFKQLHAKRQDIIIKMFKSIKEKTSLLNDFKLIVAGGLKEEDTEYFNELKAQIGSDTSIELKPNIPYQELLELYQKSMIYWHAAGYDVDEEKHPELTEHLGITPMEAMAAGCVVFAYKAGGIKEVITDGKNGYLYTTTEELLSKLQQVLSNENTRGEITKNGSNFIQENFSYSVFKEQVEKAIL